MTEANNSMFEKLSAIDVSEYVEQKNGFSFVSWPNAVKKLRENDPTATWEVKRFLDSKGNQVPYLHSDLGYFVEVAVTCGGVTISQIHPVLGENYVPLLSPTPFDINTSIARCLVKAIGLHGLGLSVYAGEDLPRDGAGVKDAGTAAEAEKKPPTDEAVQLIAQIEAALTVNKKDAASLMRWLQKDENTVLIDLNEEELRRALKALTPTKAAAK